MSPDPYIEIYQALREFPRYNQFVKSAHGLNLTVVEAHILVELDAQPGLNHKQLTALIKLDKAIISRAVSNVRSHKLLKISSAAQDARERILALSERGTTELARFDQTANAYLTAFDRVAALTREEHRILSKFVEHLADALGAPLSGRRKSEHPLRQPIRRLTRAFGLLGTKVFGSNLSALKWQALLEVYESDEGLPAGVLARILKVSESTLSEALVGLSRSGLIARKRSRIDERSNLISCSGSGVKLVESITAEQARTFRLNLGLRTEEAKHTAKVITRWITAAAVHHHTTGRGFTIRELDSDHEFQNARRMAVLSLDKGAWIPPKNFDPGSTCLGLFSDDGLYAAIEFIRERNQTFLLNATIMDSEDLEPLKALLWIAIEDTVFSIGKNLAWFLARRGERAGTSILTRSLRARIVPV